MSEQAKRKDYPLSMRLPEADIAVIDRAARLRGRSRTEFVREAAVRAAEEAVLDAGLVRMGAASFSEFVAQLDAPGKPVPQIEAVISRKPPWKE